jgi:hypothetical protein
MSSSANRIFRTPLAESAHVTDEALVVELTDGRVVSAPLAWYPRLFHGTPEERANHRLIGRGEGIHWPDLDEDISVEALILGLPSAESQLSLKHNTVDLRSGAAILRSSDPSQGGTWRGPRRHSQKVCD